MDFNPTFLASGDRQAMAALLATHLTRREIVYRNGRPVTPDIPRPDLTIAPNGTPYLYRWFLIPRRKVGGNVYLHLQVQSDPERPLHDHPWDNFSVILAGGYDELMVESQSQFIPKDKPGGGWDPRERPVVSCPLRAGETRYRPAGQPHRLLLPEEFKYTITLFSTGPVVRDWGFWCDDGWHSHEKCLVNLPDGRSIFRQPQEEIA